MRKSPQALPERGPETSEPWACPFSSPLSFSGVPLSFFINYLYSHHSLRVLGHENPGFSGSALRTRMHTPRREWCLTPAMRRWQLLRQRLLPCLQATQCVLQKITIQRAPNCPRCWHSLPSIRLELPLTPPPSAQLSPETPQLHFHLHLLSSWLLASKHCIDFPRLYQLCFCLHWELSESLEPGASLALCSQPFCNLHKCI